MVAKEHPQVTEGSQRLISVDVLDSEEASQDASIDRGGTALGEQDGISLAGVCVTEEVGDMQKDLMSSSLSSYMLKPSHLLTQVF